MSEAFADLTAATIPAHVVKARLKSLGIGWRALQTMTEAGSFPRPIRLTPKKSLYSRGAVVAALDRLERQEGGAA